MDDKLTLGDVEITRIVEYAGSVRMSPAEFFPDKGGYDSEDLLVPDFYDPATNECRAAVQTWLLRSGGRTVLVDTGVGNHKERPYAPVWSRLDTGFLDDLARAGVRPEDVDVVVNTHLHIDHVGWNTRLDHGRDAVLEHVLVAAPEHRGVLVGRVPELEVPPRHQVGGVRERGHPAPLDEPRVPADVVDVQVGVQDDVDVAWAEPDFG